MVDILIVVDELLGEPDDLSPSTPWFTAIAALKQAIFAAGSSAIAGTMQAQSSTKRVQVIPADRVTPDWDAQNPIWLPLTLNCPPHVIFPGQAIYQRCQNVAELRQYVSSLGYATGDGQFWLPVVLTDKGALYGEVIGLTATGQCVQPCHLPDRWRQPAYRLGQILLRSLAALPGVYLIQFGFRRDTICFDRLLPFPAAPAIASLGVQVPDLFTCHWRCLTHQPVTDLIITASDYQMIDPAVSVPSSYTVD